MDPCGGDFRSLPVYWFRCVVEHEAVGVRVAQAQPVWQGMVCQPNLGAHIAQDQVPCRIIRPPCEVAQFVANNRAVTVCRSQLHGRVTLNDFTPMNELSAVF